ncbi:MAG: hypothetical protein MUC83_15025 [Pirellula sp.]|nr:hypothetical protein [Pirellula sp.]
MIHTSLLREQRDRTPVNAPEALATQTPCPLGANRMRRNASPVRADWSGVRAGRYITLRFRAGITSPNENTHYGLELLFEFAAVFDHNLLAGAA